MKFIAALIVVFYVDCSEARMALEMEQKMQTEIETMSANFEEQVAKIRARSQRRIDAERKKAAKAVADWHALELELAQTKEEMLETLTKHREAQSELIEVEQDSTERIADLTIKVQDLEAELEELRDNPSSSGAMDDEQIEAIRERVEKRVLENYVSQDKVVEMKELYEDVVTKLEGRIDKLEVDVTKVTSPQQKKSATRSRGARSSSRYGSSTGSGRSKSKSSSHVSVVRSRAQARVKQSDVKRTSYSIAGSRGARGARGSPATSTVRSTSYTRRRTGTTKPSQSSSRNRAKEYAEKQRAAKMLADAARIRNRRSKKSSRTTAQSVKTSSRSKYGSASSRGGFAASTRSSRFR